MSVCIIAAVTIGFHHLQEDRLKKEEMYNYYLQRFELHFRWFISSPNIIKEIEEMALKDGFKFYEITLMKDHATQLAVKM
jgi:hypothetical protein